MRPCFHVALIAGVVMLPIAASAQDWLGFAGDSFHSSQSTVKSQPLEKIIWSKKVDFFPPYSGNHLLIHYGSPSITRSNIVLVPTKTATDNGFKVIAYDGADGTKLWTSTSRYVAPPAGWYPSFGPTLLPSAPGSTDYTVAYPESGGRVAFLSSVGGVRTKVIVPFYGKSKFAKDPTAYTENVRINTPLTAGPDGSVYFGYQVLGENPANLVSGIAKIAPDHTGTYVAGTTLSGDPDMGIPKTNGAPALSRDGARLYVVLATGDFGRGRLVSVSTANLAFQRRADLKDPVSGLDASIDFSGTASPLVAPYGDVYVGVLENPFPSNHYRGWLLHFNNSLTQTKTPSAFGWDNTPSIVPTYAVPWYTGSAPYLLFTKYNHYAQGGGGGDNKIALIDPNDTIVDPISGATVLKPIASHLGPTIDPNFGGDARMEWCVNVGVVDTKRKCILANSEDGLVYRWDLVTNTLSESIRITPGLGQAYTCTLIGPDGKVYAINNARLFAIGKKSK